MIAPRAADRSAPSPFGEVFARLRGMRATALIYLILYPTPWFYEGFHARDVVGSLAGLAVFLAVYFAHPPLHPKLWQGVAIAAIGYAMSPFHAIWAVFIVYAGSVLAAARPRRHAIAVFIVLLISLVLFCWITHRPWPDIAFGSSFSIASFVTTGLTVDLARQHRQLLEAQEEVRALAASAERERIARDLHDLLGHSLTLIAVKADLAERFWPIDSERAARETREIGEAARLALREVRAAVAGMHGASLRREMDRARDALASAGVTLHVQGDVEAIDPSQDGVLAMTLREAVTNIIRHAEARNCTVTLERDISGEVVLVVEDDGPTREPITEGNGLGGMRHRLAAAGGVLKVNRGGSGVRLEARLAAFPGAAA